MFCHKEVKLQDKEQSRCLLPWSKLLRTVIGHFCMDSVKLELMNAASKE